MAIPPGDFFMGTDFRLGGHAFEDETPRHVVTLALFYIGRFPVTEGQYDSYRRWVGGSADITSDASTTSSDPVTGVSWYEAVAYCEWLTRVLIDDPDTPEELANLLCPSDPTSVPWQVMLPSEAEWEKAARGNNGLMFPWGDVPDSNRANCEDSQIGSTSPVGCFPGGASDFGIEDVAGNVWEWTRSLWGSALLPPEWTYPYDPDNRMREELGAPRAIRRVVRGGAFNHGRLPRCAYRSRYFPTESSFDVGFRTVIRPGPAPERRENTECLPKLVS